MSFMIAKESTGSLVIVIWTDKICDILLDDEKKANILEVDNPEITKSDRKAIKENETKENQDKRMAEGITALRPSLHPQSCQ